MNSFFNIRIVEREIPSTFRPDYDGLHKAMLAANFYRTIQGDDGVFYELPPGEYQCTAAGGLVAVRDAATAIARRFDSHFRVRVTQEIVIDGDRWEDYSDEQKAAVLDHELTHIAPTGEKDEIDRPVIKMRKEDFIVWGFKEIMERHGDAAFETACRERIARFVPAAPALLTSRPLRGRCRSIRFN